MATSLSNWGPDDFSPFTFGVKIHDRKSALCFAENLQLIPTWVRCPCLLKTPILPENDLRLGIMMARCRPSKPELCPGYRLKCIACKTSISPVCGTIFDSRTSSIRCTLYLLYCWVDQIPVTKAALWSCVSIDIARDWYMCFREICEIVVGNSFIPIGGPGKSIYLYKCSTEMRLLWNGVTMVRQPVRVIGGKCPENGEGFVVRIPDTTKETLLPVTMLFIAQGSIIIAGDWSFLLQEEWQRVGYIVKSPKSLQTKFNDIGNGLKKEKGEFCNWEDEDRYLCEKMYRKIFLDGLPTKGFEFMVFVNDVCKVYPGPYKRPLFL